MGCEAQLAWKCLFMPTFFVRGWFWRVQYVRLARFSALVGVCVENYKSLCAVVTIWSPGKYPDTYYTYSILMSLYVKLSQLREKRYRFVQFCVVWTRTLTYLLEYWLNDGSGGGARVPWISWAEMVHNEAPSLWYLRVENIVRASVRQRVSASRGDAPRHWLCLGPSWMTDARPSLLQTHA